MVDRTVGLYERNTIKSHGENRASWIRFHTDVMFKPSLNTVCTIILKDLFIDKLARPVYL